MRINRACKQKGGEHMYAAIGGAIGTAIDELIDYMSDDDDDE